MITSQEYLETVKSMRKRTTRNDSSSPSSCLCDRCQLGEAFCPRSVDCTKEQEAV